MKVSLPALTATGTGYGSALSITGGAGADVITGTASADTLVGNAGNDTFTGAAGADAMTGGAGADTYIWTATSESTSVARDTIADFSVSDNDQLDISALNAGPIVFGGVSALNSVAKELVFNQSGDHTLVQFDTDGDGNSDWEIQLTTFTATTLNSTFFNFGSTPVKFTLTTQWL